MLLDRKRGKSLALLRDPSQSEARAGASRCVWQIPCKRVQGIFWKPGNFCENKLDVVGVIGKTADG
jgi:hypothetical protein